MNHNKHLKLFRKLKQKKLKEIKSNKDDIYKLAEYNV